MGTECESMSRHITRTYARVKDSASSRAFDEIFSDKINKPTAARATIHKWGKTSFTSVRGARETAFDLKRRRAEASKRTNQDPFTFELEDGPSSSRKRRTQGSGVTTIVTPAVARQVLKEHPAVGGNEPASCPDEDEEEITVVKKPVKTYTRQPLSKPKTVTPVLSENTETPSTESQNKDSISTVESSQPCSVHSSKSNDNDEDRLSDASDDECVPFKRQTLKTYSSSSSPATPQSISPRKPIKGSSKSYWEERNNYQSKTVYKSPSCTPKNPSRQETLTIIRVSPPAWFKKNPSDSQKSESDSESSSKNTELKLKYESQLYTKLPSSNNTETFDFVAESGQQISIPAVRRRPKRKFFKSRKSEMSSDDNANESEKSEENVTSNVPSQEETDLVSEIFGEDQSECSNSNGASLESEVNDSEPEMPNLSPAPPQLDSVQLEPGKEEVKEDATTNGSEEHSEPPVLKTYSRRREKPVRFESQHPRRFFKSKGQTKVEKLKAEDNAQKKIFTSPKKSPSKALYNPRTWKVEEEEDGPQKIQPKVIQKKKPAKKSVFDDDFDEEVVAKEKPKVMRTVVWPKESGDDAFTSLHVTREHKELFTVVKNVKQAHECQEIGETQEFMDDVEYLLVGLRDTEPISVRCLSCLGLATKCTMSSFRMHLRAHGIVSTVFSALHDAYTDASLSLGTASIMYMLSRDRLNMDLDRPSLDLLLKLLGVEHEEEDGTSPSKLSSAAAKELKRTKDRVREMITNLQGGVKQFDLETISTGNLAMESLLTLTSKRAGEVFKEELRILGALDHIVDTVSHCAGILESNMEETLNDQTVEYFRKVERCLRVLEQVTFCNTDNQDHLISYKKAALISAVSKILAVCEECLSHSPVSIDTESLKVDKDSVGWAIYSCMLSVLRVLLNLTHENEWGCTRIGEEENFLKIALLCCVKSPQYVPEDTRFDLLVLSLGTMINLVEHCDINRRRFISATTVTSFECSGEVREVSALESITGLFKLREEAARKAEAETLSPGDKGKDGDEDKANQSGAWEESQAGLEWVVNPARQNKPSDTPPDDGTDKSNQDEEEYFTKALHKAGRHMEDSIVASYIALLLGCVIQDNQEFVKMVKEHFEGGEFMPMIKILKKFLGFMNLTTAMTTTGGKSISRVIEILEAC